MFGQTLPDWFWVLWFFLLFYVFILEPILSSDSLWGVIFDPFVIFGRPLAFLGSSSNLSELVERQWIQQAKQLGKRKVPGGKCSSLGARFPVTFLVFSTKRQARGEPGRGPHFSSAFGLFPGPPDPRSARAGSSESRFHVFGAEPQQVFF